MGDWPVSGEFLLTRFAPGGELRTVQRQYDHMASALDRKDPVRVRATACHLAQAWLRVEIAFIRFIERTPAELGLGRQAHEGWGEVPATA